MNKKIVTIVLALTLPLTVSAYQGGDGFRSEGQGQKGNKVERLAKKLNLTADQKTKVEAIFKQQKEKFNAIKEETRIRMQDVLSSDQMKELDQIKQQRKQRKQERKENRKNNKQNKMQN